MPLHSLAFTDADMVREQAEEIEALKKALRALADEWEQAAVGDPLNGYWDGVATAERRAARQLRVLLPEDAPSA